MDNVTRPEHSNPASPPPTLAPPQAVPPCTTLCLALHPVPPQSIIPPLAPLPDLTPNPAPVPDPTPSPALAPPQFVPPCTTNGLAPHQVTRQVMAPTLAPLLDGPDPTPNQVQVPDPTPIQVPVPDPSPIQVPVPDPSPIPAPVLDPTPNPVSVPDHTPSSAPAASTTTRLPEYLMYKNRLQEYTQKSSLPLPVYQNFNEGSSHVPRFRSTVWVDEAQYTSPNTFLHRKAAEQDVANIALESILKRVKDEGCPLLHGVCEQIDKVFCKSILNEFVVKVNLEKPTYNTVQSPGLLPVFISTLVFDGVSYTGDTGRNKKEAEQLAARSVILSLLGNSGSSKIIYEIIKSKSKLYAALDRVKGPSHSQPNIVPVGVKLGHCSETTFIQEQEVSTAIVRDAVPVSAISPAASAMHPPHHDFKRLRPDPDPAPKPIPFPIDFVHPVSEQPLIIEFGSSSAKKRRKNKKKANKKTDAQFPIDAIPLNQASTCSVAQ